MAKPNLEYAICYADGGCRGNQNDSNIGAWAYTIAYQGSTMENSGTARNTTNNIRRNWYLFFSRFNNSRLWI